MVDISCSYNMNHSTISTILKSRDKMMDHVKSAVSVMSKIILKKHGKSDGEMEKLLRCTCRISISVVSHSA